VERGLNNENLKRKSQEECVLVYTTFRNEGDVFVVPHGSCHAGRELVSHCALCSVSRLYAKD